MTTEELIAVFRLTIPAMAEVSDEELASDFEVYGDYVSEKRFGKLYGKAMSYFVAHMRTLNDMITYAGGNAGDSTLTAGPLTSEKEGQLSRNYGSGSASGSSNTDDLLKRTLYGQQFLMLRDMAVSSVTIRTGGGCCGGCRR